MWLVLFVMMWLIWNLSFLVLVVRWVNLVLIVLICLSGFDLVIFVVVLFVVNLVESDWIFWNSVDSCVCIFVSVLFCVYFIEGMVNVSVIVNSFICIC